MNTGGLAVAQISHAGPRGMVPVDINTMDAAEFRQIEQWFVDASVRAQRAGFDAVEVHAAHWYLLATILNSDLNKRADSYNGSDERRIAIVCRIVEVIRLACPGLAVFVKINAHNTLEGIDDTGMLVNYAKALYEAGIDLLDVSGMSFTKQPRDAECYFLDSAHAVKEALPELNVALVGGIYSRATIDRALKSVDMVAMGRTLLTQPDFVTRLKNGELERSRCIPLQPVLQALQDQIRALHLRSRQPQTPPDFRRRKIISHKTTLRPQRNVMAAATIVILNPSTAGKKQIRDTALCQQRLPGRDIHIECQLWETDSAAYLLDSLDDGTADRRKQHPFVAVKQGEQIFATVTFISVDNLGGGRFDRHISPPCPSAGDDTQDNRA